MEDFTLVDKPWLSMNLNTVHIYYASSTKILEVNLFAFAYRLFHEDFSPINGDAAELLESLCIKAPHGHQALYHLWFQKSELHYASSIVTGWHLMRVTKVITVPSLATVTG